MKGRDEGTKEGRMGGRKDEEGAASFVCARVA